MGKIFVTSDLHLNHNKDFIWKERGYNNVQEMNQDLIKKFNETVSQEDDVWICGDLTLGELENSIPMLKELKGKIHVVLGNHDTNRRKEFYEKEMGWDCHYAMRLKYKKLSFFLVHYPCISTNIEPEALYQSTIVLYGHTHQNTNFYDNNILTYHVGVDSHNGYPIDLDDIINEIKLKIKENKNEV